MIIHLVTLKILESKGIIFWKIFVPGDSSVWIVGDGLTVFLVVYTSVVVVAVVVVVLVVVVDWVVVVGASTEVFEAFNVKEKKIEITSKGIRTWGANHN